MARHRAKPKVYGGPKQYQQVVRDPQLHLALDFHPTAINVRVHPTGHLANVAVLAFEQLQRSERRRMRKDNRDKRAVATSEFVKLSAKARITAAAQSGDLSDAQFARFLRGLV